MGIAQTTDWKERVAVLRKELEKVQADSLDNPQALERAALLEAELRALPAQLKEQKKREALAEIAQLRAEVAELWVAFEAAKLENDKAVEEVRAYRKKRNRIPAHQMQAYHEEGVLLDRRTAPALAHYEQIRTRLQVRFTRAWLAYRVGLDNSYLNRWSTGQPNTASLPVGESAWEQAAENYGRMMLRRSGL